METLIEYVRVLGEQNKGKKEGEMWNILGETFLMMEIRDNNRLRVNEMLASKPNLELTGHCGSTALHEACSRGNSGIVADLVAANANVTARNLFGYTPLMLATRTGLDQKTFSVDEKIKMMQILLDAGAEKDAVDQDGKNALHWAVGSGANQRIVQFLIDAGVNVNAKTYGTNMTPLHTHLYTYFGWQDIIDALLKAGADTTAMDKWGRTPNALMNTRQP